MMCSGELLEEKVQEFCKNNNRDEGQIWQVINNVHTRTYGRNIMWEKEQYQKENNLEDIPMAEQFAKLNLVHRAIEILKGLQECIKNGWELE
ncbi:MULTISPECIES: hypothetical protein [Clostridium]|uniref:Uncharacterized protein n=1 Tax=Candidatus Clostridium helianthi TaxID=3381660 RepID=A0ABW8S721_9CLOT|nr:hypothetical protein [Clostridium beijerinckii]MBA8933425.1 uncharacterized protein YjaG (DUF416 family) [Clostridium beijerinckii]NRU37625.1 uncharacterized protein YjaG (DUF416 family) [Clostridium beijerinckii]NSA99097.1 uncharacterized protein YjaG (DUF416 family) [Clostridium beijerinckii]OOM56957.1 hypothetical protein CLOBI_41770 [Clostridium beijerinckii]OOM66844.1 hypothetical protein CLBEIC_46170 [Clostridium beijerinckii]